MYLEKLKPIVAHYSSNSTPFLFMFVFIAQPINKIPIIEPKNGLYVLNFMLN